MQVHGFFSPIAYHLDEDNTYFPCSILHEFVWLQPLVTNTFDYAARRTWMSVSFTKWDLNTSVTNTLRIQYVHLVTCAILGDTLAHWRHLAVDNGLTRLPTYTCSNVDLRVTGRRWRNQPTQKHASTSTDKAMPQVTKSGSPDFTFCLLPHPVHLRSGGTSSKPSSRSHGIFSSRRAVRDVRYSETCSFLILRIYSLFT